ncbi:helix-turn-helix domain-containing protein [Lutibacter sp.]|uniref:helix-turn-helix domain-containing protein n=1 Tax=Lutibacter sp. TaxID=1925666 RepID=UPI002736E45E|nr:helix-turn-helix domain-containing protein [Lutibacter sp.]MDP3314086.1 helix-turn-helix domain-containing protein [Lutibacter sp.]
MIELADLILALSLEIKELKVRLEIFRQSRAEKLKDTWLDNQDVMQTLHISTRTLQSFRDNGTLPFSKVGGTFYYKVSDIEEILQNNYYNHNFKCNATK